MKKKLFITSLIFLLLIFTLGITVFAEEDAIEELPAEIIDAEVTEAPTQNAETAIEENCCDEETVQKVEIFEIAEENQREAVSDSDINTEAAEDTEKQASEIETENENSAGAEASAPAFNYVVTVSNGTTSVDLAGGSSNSVADILSRLGYDVTDAEIVIDYDTVDTNVISVEESEEGYILGDNGPFSKADRKLVVYVNGERVELTVEDPAEISGNMKASEIESAFTTAEDGNVRLTGDVTIVKESNDKFKSIELSTGTHSLYLNGLKLDGSASTLPVFIISGNAILNVYGGYDESSTADGYLWGKVQLFDVKGSGNLNILSGVAMTVQDYETFLEKESESVVTIYGGTLKENGLYWYTSHCIFINENNEAYGKTLADAVNAITTSGTIILLRDIEQTSEQEQSYTPLITLQSKTLTLDLNGNVLKGKKGNVIYVTGGSNLTLIDSAPNKAHSGSLSSLPKGGVITGGYSGSGVNPQGSGIFVNNTSNTPFTILMNGGTITGNKANECGGGVYLYDKNNNNSIFTIRGGSIINNEANPGVSGNSRGGGIFCWGATVNIEGAAIDKNKASKGGGIFASKSKINLSSGTICDNTAENDGGGIYADGSTDVINVTGGAITGNKINNKATTSYNAEVAGVKGGALTVGGSAVIVGNKDKDGNASDTRCTIYTHESILPSDGMQIGVYLSEDEKTTSTEVRVTNNNNSGIYAKYFVCNADGFTSYNKAEEQKVYMVQYKNNVIINVDTGKQYTDKQGLQYAINEAGGQSTTLRLLKDISENITIGINGEGEISQNITIDLNGKKITGKVNNCVVKIISNSTLFIIDTSKNESGEITGGSAQYGGGVFVDTGSTLKMSSGNIKNNTATKDGGGVYLKSGSTFYMSGGRITENTASEDGGGVYLTVNSTLNMSGGVIEHNVSSKKNGAYGVYVAGTDSSFATLCLSDTAKISHNGTVYNFCNCLLSGGAKINVTEGYSGLTYVSIDSTLEQGEGIDITTQNINNYIKMFYSDDGAYKVIAEKDGDKYILKLFACSIIKRPKAIEGLVYNGKEQTGLVVEEGYENIYTISNNTRTDAGSYKAIASLKDKESCVWEPEEGKPTYSEDQEIEWSIAKATPVASDFTVTGPTKLEYDGKDKTATAKTNKLGMGTITVNYYQNDTKVTDRKSTGKYEIKLSVAAGSNYNEISDLADSKWTFTVTPKQLTVDGTTVADKEYDGNTDCEVTNKGALKGKVGQDEVDFTATAAFEDANPGENKKVNVTYTLSGSAKDNYTVKGNTLTATITGKPEPEPSPSPTPTTSKEDTKDTIVVETITLNSLPASQQAVINETLKSNNLNLVAVVQVYCLSNGNRIDKGRAEFEINSTIFEGCDVRSLRAWKINDDNTMTEVPFEIVNGKIIFNNGKLGIYILAA